jgi:hypothetical protein
MLLEELGPNLEQRCGDPGGPRYGPTGALTPFK